MITGEIKNRIDQIWDTFWTGGITNSLTILEQMTYLFFMKMLDDAQLKREATAGLFGGKIDNPTFRSGESWRLTIPPSAPASPGTIRKLTAMCLTTPSAGTSSRTTRPPSCSIRFATTFSRSSRTWETPKSPPIAAS